MSLSRREKEVPRYLRASIGSCHELCKYGKKQTLEEKPWPHAMTSSSETKKVMVGKRRHASFDACEIIKREVVKKETLQTKKKTNLKLRSSSVSESQISRNVGKSSEGKDIGVKIKKDGSSKFAVTPRGLVSPKPLVRGSEKPRHRKSLSLNQKPRDVQQIDYPVKEKILHVVEVEIEKKQIQSFVIEPSHHHPPSTTQEEYDEYKVSEEDKYAYSSMSKESENEEETKNPRGRNEDESLKTEDADQEKRKTKDDDDGVTDDDDNTNGGKVALRHQDVQDKKGTQRVFNNVIEETASELVKTRKNKVKDLVRAFETLIALTKFKPLVNSAI